MPRFIGKGSRPSRRIRKNRYYLLVKKKDKIAYMNIARTGIVYIVIVHLMSTLTYF